MPWTGLEWIRTSEAKARERAPQGLPNGEPNLSETWSPMLCHWAERDEQGKGGKRRYRNK